MTLSVAQWQTFQTFATACVIVSFQVYNVWKHRENHTAIAQTATKVEADLDDAHSKIEKLNVKLVGGDRRAARAPAPPAGLAPDLRRWTDPPAAKAAEQKKNAD